MTGISFLREVNINAPLIELCKASDLDPNAVKAHVDLSPTSPPCLVFALKIIFETHEPDSAAVKEITKYLIKKIPHYTRHDLTLITLAIKNKFNDIAINLIESYFSVLSDCDNEHFCRLLEIILTNYSLENSRINDLIDILMDRIHSVDEKLIQSALKGGFWNIVEKLKKQYPEIDLNEIAYQLVGRFKTKDNEFGNCVLHYSIFIEDNNYLERCLKQWIDPNAKNLKGQTALMVLMSQSSVANIESKLELLRAYNADINACDNQLETPLYYAIKAGNIKGIQWLLKNGANIHAINANKETPVLLSCKTDYRYLRPILDSHLSQIKSPFFFVLTKFCLGSELKGSEKDMLETLEGKIQNFSDNEFFNLIYFFFEVNFFDAIKALMELKTSLNRLQRDNNTFIIKAFEMRSLEMIKILIEGGTNLKAVNSAGNNALHLAAELGYDSLIEPLIQRGIDPNSLNKKRCTPLHFAAFKYQIKIVQTLLQLQADPSIKNSGGVLPFNSIFPPTRQDKLADYNAIRSLLS